MISPMTFVYLAFKALVLSAVTLRITDNHAPSQGDYIAGKQADGRSRSFQSPPHLGRPVGCATDVPADDRFASYIRLMIG